MISEYNEKLGVNNEFLFNAINIVEEYYLYPKTYGDLAHIISIEFNCICKEKDISNYFNTGKIVKSNNIFNKQVTVENVDTHIKCNVCFDTKQIYNGVKYVKCNNCRE